MNHPLNLSRKKIKSIGNALLSWYKQEGRDLPWRNTTDPYKILISEIMLQQTQVDHVISYYRRFLNQFPDFEALSQATNAEMIKAWAGLGYNRRAIMLRDIAKAICASQIPTCEEDWRALKGIGPYTASALTVFSLRGRSFPVDTNTRRTISRIFFANPYPDQKMDEDIKHAGTQLLQLAEPFYDLPQALFDLASIYCKKRPDCSACPLQVSCLSAKDFLEDRIPTPKRMTKKPKERVKEGKDFPDRIYRGRILKVVRIRGAVSLDNALGLEIDPSFKQEVDLEWLSDMVDRLEKDCLLTNSQGTLSLPE